LDAAVQSFGKLIQSADVALFYFAGHGVQVLEPVSKLPITSSVIKFGLASAFAGAEDLKR
jgi:hypothetical protein